MKSTSETESEAIVKAVNGGALIDSTRRRSWDSSSLVYR
jgi:hypothetical protein